MVIESFHLTATKQAEGTNVTSFGSTCSQACIVISLDTVEIICIQTKWRNVEHKKSNAATQLTQIPPISQRKLCLSEPSGELCDHRQNAQIRSVHISSSHTSSHANSAHPFSAQSKTVNTKIRSKSWTWWFESRLTAYLMASKQPQGVRPFSGQPLSPTSLPFVCLIKVRILKIFMFWMFPEIPIQCIYYLSSLTIYSLLSTAVSELLSYVTVDPTTDHFHLLLAHIKSIQLLKHGVAFTVKQSQKTQCTCQRLALAMIVHQKYFILHFFSSVDHFLVFVRQ